MAISAFRPLASRFYHAGVQTGFAHLWSRQREGRANLSRSMLSLRRRSGCDLNGQQRSEQQRQRLRAAARPVAEPMGRRVFLDAVPTAGIRVADVSTAGGTELSVTVVYADDARISYPTIGQSDVVVTTASGAELTHVSWQAD